MKKICAIILILTSISLSGKAWETDSLSISTLPDEIGSPWCDTIAVIKDAHRVIITESERNAKLVVTGSGSDSKYYYRYGIEPKVDTIVAPETPIGVNLPFAGNMGEKSTHYRFLKNIYGGINMPVGPGKELKAGWEAGIAEVIGFGYTPSVHTTFSVGFGFGYRCLKTTDGMLFTKSGDILSLTPATGYHKASATMNFWSLQFPLLYTQTFGANKIGFSLGVILNLNVSTKATNKWEVDDISYKSTIENLHQRFFTPDIILTIGRRDIAGAYVKFSPMDAMMRYHGPKMSTLSAGLNFNF